MSRGKWLQLASITLLTVGTLVSTACASKSINHVLVDPARYRDREVTVAGTVTESFSVAERGAYLVEDRTGRLWVVSNRSTPRKGARVTVTGTVREGFNLGSLGDLIRVPGLSSGLVLMESSRRARD